jgi:hypothetical protein
MSSVEELKLRVEQLERELADCRSRLSVGDDGAAALPRVSRQKINVLSAEVVDSNPYRCGLRQVLFTRAINSTVVLVVADCTSAVQQLLTV